MLDMYNWIRGVRTKLILDHCACNFPSAFPCQTIIGHSAEYRVKHNYFISIYWLSRNIIDDSDDIILMGHHRISAINI